MEIDLVKLSSQRLREALSEAHLTQQELSVKSGVSKCSISQYMNATHAPSNISSGMIAKVLGVSPVWLMGFDVPKYETTKEVKPLGELYTNIDSRVFNKLLENLSLLTPEGQEEALKRIEDLTYNPKYVFVPTLDRIEIEILGGNPE